MTWQDLINGLFELLAGLFVLMHCRKLYHDKMVRGVSLVATIFFFSWGLWNLYYYPHLEQWLSFWGGISIATANFLWIGMMIYYTAKERKKLHEEEYLKALTDLADHKVNKRFLTAKERKKLHEAEYLGSHRPC